MTAASFQVRLVTYAAFGVQPLAGVGRHEVCGVSAEHDASDPPVLGLCGGVGVDDLSQDLGGVRVGVLGDHP